MTTSSRLLLAAVLPLMVGASKPTVHLINESRTYAQRPYMWCGVDVRGNTNTITYAWEKDIKKVTCKECLKRMKKKFVGDVVDLTKGGESYWFQLQQIPWAYVNKDGTRIRIYTALRRITPRQQLFITAKPRRSRWRIY